MRWWMCAVMLACLAGCRGDDSTEGSKPVEAASASSATVSDAQQSAAPDSRPSIEVPVSKEEQAFITPPVDFTGDAAAAFYRMVKKDPEVKRVRMPPIPGMEDADKADKQPFIDDFKTAVFFSKSIRLADGSTLYDLITHCSTGWHDGATAAQIAVADPAHPYVYLQYFMKFRAAEEGFDTEPQALFERYGSRIVAKSGFANSLLSDPDFMQHSGLRCK